MALKASSTKERPITSPFGTVEIENDGETHIRKVRFVSMGLFNPKVGGPQYEPPTEETVNRYYEKKYSEDQIEREFKQFLLNNRKKAALKEKWEQFKKQWYEDHDPDQWHLLDENVAESEFMKMHEDKVEVLFDIEPASSKDYEPQESISDEDALQFNVIPMMKAGKEEEIIEKPVEAPPEEVKEAEKKLYFGKERESWDNIDKMSEFVKKSRGLLYLSSITAFIPGNLAKNETHRKEMNDFILEVANVKKRPNLDAWFAKYDLEKPDVIKDYYYYIFGQSGTSWFVRQLAMTVNLTFGRLNYLENLLKKVDAGKLKEFQAKILEAAPPRAAGYTSFSKLANAIVIRSDSAEFDVGATEEMLNMLGFDKTFEAEVMKERCTARRYLNMIARDNEQLEMDPYSLINHYITNKNIRKSSNENWDEKIDEKTGTKVGSMIPAKTIWHFKNLFMTPKNKVKLSLHDPKSDLFLTYLVFLKENLGIKHLSLATSVLLRRLSNEVNLARLTNFFITDLREYLHIFYGKDPLFRKFLENAKNLRKFRQLPLLDIDLITFCLWKCSTQMPLGKGIRAVTPPQLNPMAQIWIYTNIIKECAVNNTFQKLLAVGTVKEKSTKGSQQELTFNEPMFKHLNASTLDEIEILITDKFGNPIPFRGGPSTVVLQFETA